MEKTKLSWYTMIVTFLAGIGSFGLIALLGSSIDSNGILHEPFFLSPMGYFFLLISLISGLIHLYQRNH
ncbi:DUF3955 domain-containing protein [Companilactobacillus zhachilii]|uniref:DUF3955 domain-containing protein n=1 Tax=Companilactobacillus zhachilii TaxID=2304606 RepID=A0A386PT64_9LACO|nr:DUF3955 domain-containing protein [Companilactobacillus zhachilii]AYE39204.1 DUF3955 domain-containing protein [Companilactobacillus zhachilii]